LFRQISIRKYFMADGDGVPGKKTLSPVVHRQPELAAAGQRLELPSVRTESKIAAAKRIGAPGPRPLHTAVAASVGAVNPAVDAPRQSIGAQLLVPGAETGEEHAALVRFPVAVRVLQK